MVTSNGSGGKISGINRPSLDWPEACEGGGGKPITGPQLPSLRRHNPDQVRRVHGNTASQPLSGTPLGKTNVFRWHRKVNTGPDLIGLRGSALVAMRCQADSAIISGCFWTGGAWDADGLRAAGLREKFEELESRKTVLTAETEQRALAATAPVFQGKLAEVYRARVAGLRDATQKYLTGELGGTTRFGCEGGDPSCRGW